MRVFLSGPMGSGKSTVAKAVAARMGLPSWDLDAVVEQRAGTTVGQLFAERGEPAFRELERATLRALIAGSTDAVFALGGGTVTDRALRRELIGAGVLVTLHAPLATLAERVGTGKDRPLLDGQDVQARLAELIAARADAYAECHGQVSTSDRDLQSIAADVMEIAVAQPLVVPLGARSYRVAIGAGIRTRLPAHVAAMAGGSRVLVVSDDVVAPLWADSLCASLAADGRDVVRVTLPAGEQHKTLASVQRIWEAGLQAGIDRGGGVIAIGGGVVGDLSGFAASTLLRGIPIGHVPTTLLSMVDSAIGGKTGFDTAHGKNLIGSFYQPSFVLCDIETLTTLPEAERRAGLAEVVKSAWIDGEAAVTRLERERHALLSGERDATAAAIRMSAGLKARIVTDDEQERGMRGLLNLGHTLGHAIEAWLGYRGMRHGEAISLGMVAAFQVAERLGTGTAAARMRMVELLSGLGLPTDVSPYLKDEVFGYLTSDKKRRGEALTFVLPGEPGNVTLHPIRLDELKGTLRGG